MDRNRFKTNNLPCNHALAIFLETRNRNFLGFAFLRILLVWYHLLIIVPWWLAAGCPDVIINRTMVSGKCEHFITHHMVNTRINGAFFMKHYE